ncbi:hypothetical protein BASA81_005489 [Batrachochytrium salamandrivorans]|nr:hypothetical protein BASA81_005489 [Batrachochytrium salamandrivorans]
MSYFGHVYPGLFYVCYATIMLCGARINRHDSKTVAFGSRKEMGFSALYFLACFLAGIGIEGAGGVITFGDFFYQYSHQVSYVGYLVAAVACVLELKGRVSRGTWKVTFAFAMLVEGWVMIGHLLMQDQPESTLHAVMVVMSVFISMCLFLSVFSHHGVFFQSAALAGFLTKGMWFFYIAEVVYSGKYGDRGQHAHTGDIVATAGLMAVICQAIVGVVMAVHCGGDPPLPEDVVMTTTNKQDEYFQVPPREV